MDRLYKILIIDDDEYSADNLCLELKRYGQLMVEGIARNGSNGKISFVPISYFWM